MLMENVNCHCEEAVVENILILTNFICLKITNPTNKIPNKSNKKKPNKSVGEF